jgi:hypothetical protein
MCAGGGEEKSLLIAAIVSFDFLTCLYVSLPCRPHLLRISETADRRNQYVPQTKL